MKIEFSKLKKLVVETKSGFVLGKVKDIVFETEGQTILQYEIGEVFGRKYLISREQIVSIDEKKMIVEDGVINVGTGLDLSGKKIKINAEPEGVVMRET